MPTDGAADEHMKRTRSYTSMGSPAMTDIINQYMTSHERYNTPTSALQQVHDANRPLSRSSTRQSVSFETIPAWAKAETTRTEDAHSDVDSALSRVASRAEAVSEVIPEVTIVYTDNARAAGGEEEVATQDEDSVTVPSQTQLAQSQGN